MIDLPSPNFDTRNGAAVDMLVLHYTGMPTAQAALDRLRENIPGRRVSAHYVVDEGGEVYAMVPEEMRAWHAGVSQWRGRGEVNARSIGIEIVNPGHEYGYRPFPAAQMAAVTALCREILSRHAIPARNVVAHSDIAPTRKEDPGELFDWPGLAKAGAGLWPQPGADAAAAERLQDYGYDIADLSAAIRAFQRHFRPARLNGAWDAECAKLLAALLAME